MPDLRRTPDEKVEISTDIFATTPPASFRKCRNRAFFTAESGCSRYHCLVPFFNRFRRVFAPFSAIHARIAPSSSMRLAASSKASGSNFEKSQQMFIESNGFVIVSVEQTFAMQFCFVDQTRQMHVAAEPFVGTPWENFAH